MTDLKANQFTIKNGKLVPRTSSPSRSESHYRVIPYQHVVRVTSEDYFNATLLEYKKQLQQVKKQYAELQNAYWHLIGSQQVEKSLRTCSSIPKIQEDIKDNETMTDSIIWRDKELNFDSSRKTAPLGRSVIEPWNSLRQSIEEYSQNRSKTIESEWHEQEEELKRAKEEVDELKEELLETKKKLEFQSEGMRKFYEKNMKKMEEVVVRQRKHTKLLNGVIQRVRSEQQAKDDLIKAILAMKSTDKHSIYKLAKTLNVPL